MSEASITLIIAIVSSPIWVPAFEYIRNRIWAKINFHGWQAIFLNTQDGITTYFGHITSVSRDEVILRDIYYLKDSDEATPENIYYLKVPRLIKLGEDELHGPEDMMIINRQHVAFLENMTEQAPITKMILEHQSKKNT